MESCFGGHLLILKGYVYRRKSVISGKSYWNCSRPKCSAKGILFSDGEFKLTNSQHRHDPDFENLKRKEKLVELKKLALQVDVPGYDLLEALQIKDDIKKYLSLIRTWRWRNKKKNRPTLSAELPLNVGLDYRLLPSRISSKEMLFHSGYYFRQDSINPRNEKCKYWRCRVKKCKARAKTDHVGNLTILKSAHNHTSEKNEETSTRLEEMLNAPMPVIRERVRHEQYGLQEQYSNKSDTSRKFSWRTKREPEITKVEKLKAGAESVPIIQETNSPFCAPDSFSFDKLMAETLNENYCATHEFNNDSLNLLKNE